MKTYVNIPLIFVVTIIDLIYMEYKHGYLPLKLLMEQLYAVSSIGIEPLFIVKWLLLLSCKVSSTRIMIEKIMLILIGPS